MNANEIYHETWSALTGDLNIEAEFPRPLLAHYCSINTLEQILRGQELWLSNPLFMNDLEEVRFGVVTGYELAITNESLSHALKTADRRTAFFDALRGLYERFTSDLVFDCYVACFSEHKRDDDDGLLSMWRAYGANGGGAALVFDVNSVSTPETPGVGLALGKVQYGTSKERSEWLSKKVEEAAALVRDTDIPTHFLHMVAGALFERIKMMALFSKHVGFKEENEWRLVYISQYDPDGNLKQFIGYSVGLRGVEPKLKLPLKGKLPGLNLDISLTAITDRILLGPSVSDSLARKSVCRMLELLNLPELGAKVRGSTIPLRPSFHVPGR